MTVAIMLLTYAANVERHAYAMTTLRSALAHIRTAQPLRLHIADDGSPHPGHVTALVDEAVKFGIPITVSSTNHLGYGANYNAGTRTVHDLAEYIVPLEDDWELVRDLDLDPLIETLDSGMVGCLRMGILGYTQDLRGTFTHPPGTYRTLFVFHPDSAEPHVFAGHPRIETREWERAVGPWPDVPGMLPGEVEVSVCKRLAARVGVGWDFDVLSPRGDLFVHIGSVRSTD